MNLHCSSFDAGRCVVDFAVFFVVVVIVLIAPQQAGISDSCRLEEKDKLAGVEIVKEACDESSREEELVEAICDELADGGITVEFASGASLHRQHFS